ncbi:MAG: hypothetical protein IKP20_08305 [Candidatus Methanomethylophilaceae archaeon]|nr:hypothetical protein [Candidatus Methanomethylophilaceae archaeon]
MMIVERSMGYPEIRDVLEGKRVFVWTCNTCARFCGAGGKEYAEKMASDLKEDGLDVAGVLSTSAACFMKNAEKMAGEAQECDAILALCCGIGASCARRASSIEVINPVRTLGVGYLDSEGIPRIS